MYILSLCLYSPSSVTYVYSTLKVKVNLQIAFLITLVQFNKSKQKLLKQKQSE
jgi:hypothetical protein